MIAEGEEQTKQRREELSSRGTQCRFTSVEERLLRTFDSFLRRDALYSTDRDEGEKKQPLQSLVSPL